MQIKGSLYPDVLKKPVAESKLAAVRTARGGAGSSGNVPIFPVLEKPHATQESVETRLQWMIAEIQYLLKRRKSGQLPDNEVEIMIARIKNVSRRRKTFAFVSSIFKAHLSTPETN